MAEEFISVRIRLADARKFAADAALDAAAIKGIGDAADATSVRLGRASRSSFLHSQALYTMRRAAFAATGALVGLGAATVFMGIRFNSTMEQNTISLGHFLGSTQAATAELNTLYQLAAQTPFEFPQLTAAASRFLAFGFSLKETNQDLRIIGDTAAGLGAGAEGIDRLVLVFGQMHATGRILGNDLLQLAALGVPALQILQKQLHLTGDQMRQLQQGNLQISADVGIPALMRGLQKQFGGLSKLQAESFQGLTSTLHDYLAQLAGIVTHPLFVRLEQSLRRLNPLVGALGKAFKAGGWDAMFRTLDQGVGANGRLVNAWNQLRDAGAALFTVVRQSVLPVLEGLFGLFGPGSAVFGAFVGVLRLVSRHTTLLKIALILLAARYVYLRGVTAASTAAMWLYNAVIRAATIGTWLLNAAERAAAASMWLLNIAMDANPIGLVVIGVAALGIGLAWLALKTNVLSDVWKATWGWVKANWPLLLGILTGPIGLAVALIVTHLDTVKRWFSSFTGWLTSAVDWIGNLFAGLGKRIADAFRGAINWLLRGWNRLEFGIPGFHVGPVHFPGLMVGTPDIPLLATGGIVRETGLAVVHQNETILPARAAPLQAGVEGELHVHLHLDGREVAESVVRFPALLADAVFRQAAFQGARA